MAMIRNSNNAAIPVRKATTARGENWPGPMAAFPKTGASPRKNADTSAALIPVIRPFCIRIIAFKIVGHGAARVHFGWLRYIKRIAALPCFSVSNTI